MLAAAAVLGLASCGDGDDSDSSSPASNPDTTGTTSAPTKTITPRQGRRIRRNRAKTIAKVNAVCRRADVQLDAPGISANDPPRQIERRAARLKDVYADAAKQLELLKAERSKSARDVGTGVARATQALDSASRSLALIEQVAQTGAVETIEPSIKLLDSAIRRYQTVVRRYGFSDCY